VECCHGSLTGIAERIPSVLILRPSRKIEEIFAMKKLFLLCLALCVMLFVVANVSFAADETTVKGYVADSKCGAKGASSDPKAAECTKKCLKAGAKMVVVTDGDQKVLTVANPEKLEGHEGHHVAVTGHVEGDSLHVMSVQML
jgi:hypothetical protein